MAENTQPEPAPESNAALWLAVGRLQSDVARVIDGQGELRTDLAETNRRITESNSETNRRITESNSETNQRIAESNGETNRRIDESNRRMDRLFYALIGVGAGVIGTLVAVLMRGV